MGGREKAGGWFDYVCLDAAHIKAYANIPLEPIEWWYRENEGKGMEEG